MNIMDIKMEVAYYAPWVMSLFFCISLLDDESPTSANLGNDHGFIIKE